MGPLLGRMLMRTLLFTLACVLAALPALAASAMAQTRETVTVHGSAYGQILHDGRGFALYAFTRDTAGRSNCSGACASAWPPYIVPRRATAGSGVRAALLGTVRRADGRLQASYAGRPLYYYIGDRRPLQVLCQNVTEFGGVWLVVRPDCRPDPSAASTPQTTGAGPRR